MAQIKPKTNKNIVTVGELKKKRAEKLAENAQMEGMMKVDGESDPEYLKRIAANNASISKYNKIIANPEKYKPAAPAKNPNIVPVGRLKQVRDSLDEKSSSKSKTAVLTNISLEKYLQSENPDPAIVKRLREKAQQFAASSVADMERAARYDRIIKKASKKK